MATIGLLLVASVAIGLLVPSDWDAFDPDVQVGWAAYAFVVGAVPTPSPLWSCGSGERLVSTADAETQRVTRRQLISRNG